ncbi:hypothetical protein FACS1894202_07010 [Clostridia bacterium]|nr:hypothetical protein FACS1894202_07010 [Clostridia bacterium]
MLAKHEYERISGRSLGKNDVLAYHIRQSFKPGEVTPEEANEIGRQLVLSFTKGKHSFVVCTHIDKAHVHNHIIFNSTTLDHTHKFVDFFRSGRVVRKISDLLCAEHGLSVIENPKPPHEHYGEWLGDKKAPSGRDIIRAKIDELMPSCKTFDEFLDALRKAEYIVKDGGKYISVQAPGQKKPTRLKTLGDDYTEAAIKARLGVQKVRVSGGDSGTHTKVNLLIDIQEKIRQGKGAGYEHFAKLFNLKEAAKTLLFLQERGISTYEELAKKSAAASAELSTINKRISEIEVQQKEISELQKQIGVYSKTRAVYETYRKSGWKRSYYDEHTADIVAHRAAKKFFDAQNLGGKLPPVATLKQEWATLNSEKKLLWSDYHRLKDNARELAIALGNTKQILGIEKGGQTAETTRETPRTTKQRNAER